MWYTWKKSLVNFQDKKDYKTCFKTQIDRNLFSKVFSLLLLFQSTESWKFSKWKSDYLVLDIVVIPIKLTIGDSAFQLCIEHKTNGTFQFRKISWKIEISQRNKFRREIMYSTLQHDTPSCWIAAKRTERSANLHLTITRELVSSNTAENAKK